MIAVRKVAANLRRGLIHADTGVISMEVSVLRHQEWTRASQILRDHPADRANSSGGRMRGGCGNWGR